MALMGYSWTLASGGQSTHPAFLRPGIFLSCGSFVLLIAFSAFYSILYIFLTPELVLSPQKLLQSKSGAWILSLEYLGLENHVDLDTNISLHTIWELLSAKRFLPIIFIRFSWIELCMKQLCRPVIKME